MLPTGPDAIRHPQPARCALCQGCLLAPARPAPGRAAPISAWPKSLLSSPAAASAHKSLGLHLRLSAHTPSACGWSKLDCHHLIQETKSYSKMTFAVLLLSRHAQNTHITLQLKILRLLLCDCWVLSPRYLKVNSDNNRINRCSQPGNGQCWAAAWQESCSHQSHLIQMNALLITFMLYSYIMIVSGYISGYISSALDKL